MKFVWVFELIGVVEEESKVDVNEQEQLYPARRGRGRVHVCRARWDDAVRGALTPDVIVVCESGSLWSLQRSERRSCCSGDFWQFERGVDETAQAQLRVSNLGMIK